MTLFPPPSSLVALFTSVFEISSKPASQTVAATSIAPIASITPAASISPLASMASVKSTSPAAVTVLPSPMISSSRATISQQPAILTTSTEVILSTSIEITLSTSSDIIIVTTTSTSVAEVTSTSSIAQGVAPQAQAQSAVSSAIIISSAPAMANTARPAASIQAAGVADQSPSTVTFAAGQPSPTAIQPGTIGPFAPQEAVEGLYPTKTLDVPLSAVFLALFLAGAATHMTIYNKNSKRGHKFILSDLVFDFCMVRSVTTTMRIVWAFKPLNNSVVLAALIFEGAGVTVLFAVNIVFTQRLLRAMNPKVGWHPITNTFFKFMIASVPAIIVYNITVLTISFFAITPRAAELSRGFLLFGSSWTFFQSIFPMIILIIACFLPSGPPGTEPKIENFGSIGRFGSKVGILMLATAFLGVGAFVRLFAAVVVAPINDPGLLHEKPMFYVTGFFFEILVVIFYAIVRIDLRFWIPNGAFGPGSYKFIPEGGAGQDDDEKTLSGNEGDMGFSKIDSRVSNISGPDLSGRWQDRAVDRRSASRDQVRQAINDLQLNAELVGQPMDAGGDNELLVYAFKVKKDGSVAMEAQGPRRFLTSRGDVVI